MKHTLKGQTMRLTTILAAATILAGCSKEKTETPPPEPETHSTEVTIYATEQNKVFGGTAKYFCSDFIPGSPLPKHWYEIDVMLTDGAQSGSDESLWISNDTLYIKKIFSLAKITGIDVILLTDYDNGHPKGNSIADQFVIRYNDTDTMDMKECFRMGNTLDWQDGLICLLISRTLPSGANNNDFFGMRQDRQNLGALLQLTLEDSTIIETRPSLELWF